MSTPAPERVCVVGSGWAFTSGISYYTCRLATALAEEHEVSTILMRRLIPKVLYPGRTRVGKRVNKIEYPEKMPVYDGIDWFWGTTVIGALRFLRRERPTVVVFQWWTGAVLHSQLLLALAARRMGARIVIEFHETQDTGEARFNGAAAYLNFVGAKLIQLASSFVVHSDYDLAAVSKRFPIGDRPIYVAPHGPYDHYADSAHEAQTTRSDVVGTDDDATVLLFFGTVRPYKGLEFLVSAFNSLEASEAAKLRLVIVGETWEGWSQPIIEAREGRNADKITVVNRYVSDEEVADFFTLADVAVLPYTRSSASGPLHVAMAYGLPTILSDVGGLRDGAEGYDGVIWVAPSSEASLKEAILAAPAAKGQRFQDPRSWGETTKIFDQLFDELPAATQPR
ncbi:glycosyltransferase involved in cell wall bisynthesis [Jatrophihabitans sp. GAS493]|uniref:glycosyltransferase n=1 Tax=Jatrophihabitans sp. GAS493 TaxID=1907575 RepID=UPI000BB72203|nr:glycosyltransferase [Jatrophihabitans sp. GAS493]SOD71575.1 glycosyltransferase involved in cell wall bisynthesis [Jatrophihabitans sp. GAS493]